MIKINLKKQTLVSLIIALSMGIYLALLPIDMFVDRDNYINYAQYPDLIIQRYLSSGTFTLIANEPVFLIILMILKKLLNPENSIRTIIFFSTFTVFFTVLKNIEYKYYFLALAFLLLPQVLKNHIIHLRQGLALSVFLIGWYSNSIKIKSLLFIVSALIHSSFIIIVSGIFFVRSINILNISNTIKYILYTLSALAVALSGLLVAELLGARQANLYSEETYNQELGLGFVFWLCILSIYISQGKAFSNNNAYSIFFLVLYLITYFYLPVTARIFESFIIIILLSSIELKRNKKLTFCILYACYFIALWAVRVTKPGFGWDVINYQ